MQISIDISTPTDKAQLEFIECTNSLVEVRLLLKLEVLSRKVLHINLQSGTAVSVDAVRAAYKAAQFECVQEDRVSDVSVNHGVLFEGIVAAITPNLAHRADSTSCMLSGSGYELAKVYRDGYPIWRIVRGAGGSHVKVGSLKFASLKQIHDMFGIDGSQPTGRSRKYPLMQTMFVD